MRGYKNEKDTVYSCLQGIYDPVEEYIFCFLTDNPVLKWLFLHFSLVSLLKSCINKCITEKCLNYQLSFIEIQGHYGSKKDKQSHLPKVTQLIAT